MKIRYIFILVSVLSLVAYVALQRGENSNLTSTAQAPSKVEATPMETEASATVVRLAAEEYPPFSSEKIPGKGILSTVIREAFELEGIEVKITFYPGARALKRTEMGLSDGTFNWADREERHKIYYYSDRLMEAEDELFFFQKGLDFKWDAKKQDYSTIAGWTVAANRGYNYGVKFQEAEKNNVIQVYRVSTMNQAFTMLQKERVKLFIHYKLVGLNFLNENYTMEQKRQFDFTLAIDEPTAYDYILFSKRSSYGKLFLHAFNRGIRKLRASGRYEQIFSTWSAANELDN